MLGLAALQRASSKGRLRCGAARRCKGGSGLQLMLAQRVVRSRSEPAAASPWRRGAGCAQNACLRGSRRGSWTTKYACLAETYTEPVFVVLWAPRRATRPGFPLPPAGAGSHASAVQATQLHLTFIRGRGKMSGVRRLLAPVASVLWALMLASLHLSPFLSVHVEPPRPWFWVQEWGVSPIPGGCNKV